MVHFYYRKFIKCYLEEFVPNACRIMRIEYEFSHAGQQDGHGPWHGDLRRDFAECIFRNMDVEPIKECLKNNNIKGFGDFLSYGMTVEPTNAKSPDLFSMPVYLMKLWFSFSPEEDANFLAKQFIKSGTKNEIRNRKFRQNTSSVEGFHERWNLSTLQM